MPKMVPYLCANDRITPRAAREFAEKVHTSKGGRVLYRLFENHASARVSTYGFRKRDVFEGLGIDFVMTPMRGTLTGMYGVFGVPASSVSEPAPSRGGRPRKNASR
jgi:hypothetical protein